MDILVRIQYLRRQKVMYLTPQEIFEYLNLLLVFKKSVFEVQQKSLSTPWELSTEVYEIGGISVSELSGEEVLQKCPYTLFYYFSEDGRKLFKVGREVK